MLITSSVAVGTYVLVAFFYGTYLILFGCTMYFLWNRRQYSTRRTMVAIGSALSLLFALATVHMILSLLQLFLYVLTAPTMSSQFQYYKGGAVYLTEISKAIWIANMVIADSLVAWRGWVLWNRVVWIIPTFLVLEMSLVACAIGHTIAYFQPISKTSSNSAVSAWYIGLSVLSLSTNLLASGLISFRIYQAGNQNPHINGRAQGKKYRSLLWIYLESGSIYPTLLIISLALYFSNSPFWWLAITISPHIAGVMPTLMVLAVISAGRSLSESTTTDSCTDPNSRSINLQTRRSNIHQFITTESLSQLTDLENEPGVQAYEGFKSTRITSNSHRMF